MWNFFVVLFDAFLICFHFPDLFYISMGDERRRRWKHILDMKGWR